MGEIVNLRVAKKRRARAEVAEQAAQNRVRHGRTGAQKRADAQAAQRQQAALDAARIEPPPER